eukprot:21466-Heterococcus_DN1.PRE.3
MTEAARCCSCKAAVVKVKVAEADVHCLSASKRTTSFSRLIDESKVLYTFQPVVSSTATLSPLALSGIVL